MSADREPTRDGAEGRGLGYVTEVTVSVCSYLAVYLIGFFLLRHLVDSRDWLQLLPAARRSAYLTQAVGADLLGHVAVLSVPLLMVGTVLCYLREQDPLRGLGLTGRLRDIVLAFAAGLAGIGLYLLLLLVIAALGGEQPGRLLLAIGLAALRQCRQWAELGWLASAAFPAAGFSYATARLLLPFGHLNPLLRERLHPAAAAAVCAGLFVAPCLLTPAITPLAVLNLTLMGLVLERLRVRTGSLWPALTGFGAWILLAELCSLPYQGAMLAMPPGYTTIPAVLSGGAFGPEGGLPATLMLAVCLLLLIGRPRRAE